jgi:DNA polymerase III subunit delta'
MSFSSILGNPNVKKELQRLLDKGAVPNSMLFAGPDGVGKKLFAKELAIALLYPEGASDSQRARIETENHPDLHLLSPEGKTGMHAIAAIRKMIDELFLAPFEAKAKVFIIEEAERMLSSSSNALLKTLEEPALDSYLILLCSRADELLPTISSRCAKIRFSPLTEEEIKTLLEEKWEKHSLSSKYIAALAQGSAAQAFALAHHPLHEERSQTLFALLSKKGLSFGEWSLALAKIEELYSKEEEGSTEWYKDVQILFAQIFMWYRDLHLLKRGGDLSHLYFLDKLPQLQERVLLPLPSFEKLHEMLEKARMGVERNIKLKAVLEYLFLELGVA